MARRAARHHLFAANLVVNRQLITLLAREVVFPPIHVRDLGLRPDVLSRITVTGNTPFHLQGIFLVDGRHLINLPVTGRTADPLCNVDAVVEVNKFRQIVNSFPQDRFILTEASPHRLKITRVVKELAMTVHTSLRRRHPRGRGGFHRCVAIPAIDPVVADVMLVAELNRLLFFEISPRKI